MSVKLIWSTPEAEKYILYMARVSSDHQDSDDTKLLAYLIKHGHWSPFEMVNMCIEIVTSRAISAQILRHRSFSFQEFSQRYAEVNEFIRYPSRRQDVKNRQNSIDDLPNDIREDFKQWQSYIEQTATNAYKWAIQAGVAKECARMLLPMSTKTKLYMNGNLRSWIHYLQLRTDDSTQLEHREIAEQIKRVFKENFPIISGAILGDYNG